MKVTTRIMRLLDEEFQIMLELEEQGRYRNQPFALKQDLTDILLKVNALKMYDK